jgi:hypothetical protein
MAAGPPTWLQEQDPELAPVLRFMVLRGGALED